MDQEFVRIGYFVNNEYAEPFEPENYPNPVKINMLYRNILANEPRVTRYAIDWTGQAPLGAPLEPAQEGEIPIENPDDEEVDMAEEMEEDAGSEEDEEDDDDGDEDIDLEADGSMDGDEVDDGEEAGDDDDDEDIENGEPIQYIDEDSMDVRQMQVEDIGTNSHSYPAQFREFL